MGVPVWWGQAQPGAVGGTGVVGARAEPSSSTHSHCSSLPSAFLVFSFGGTGMKHHSPPQRLSLSPGTTTTFQPPWPGSSPAHGNFQQVLLLPDSFRDYSPVKNKRESRNAPVTHLLQGNPAEESRLHYGTSSMSVFVF